MSGINNLTVIESLKWWRTTLGYWNMAAVAMDPPQFYRCYSFIKTLHLLSIDRGLPVAMFDYLLGIQNGFGLANCSDTDADWWQGPRTLTEKFIHQFQPKKVFLSGNFDLIQIIQMIQSSWIPSSSQSNGGTHLSGTIIVLEAFAIIKASSNSQKMIPSVVMDGHGWSWIILEVSSII